MIAHIAGLPFEEAIPQLAPVVVGAVVAVRLLQARARSWARSLHRRAGSSVLGALVLAVVALAGSATALADPGGNGAATITGSFSDRCRDFTARSSKDISHVELRYADGRVAKDETVESPEYAIHGDAGDEVDAAVVKSGTTTATFTCSATNDPPTAVLEIKAPPLSDCMYAPGWPEYATCLAWDPRTVWSTPPDGELAFIVVRPEAPEDLTFSFRGTNSTDPDDDIASSSIDFGDGTSTSGEWATEPPEDLTFSFRGTNSTDPDDDIASWSIDFGDGTSTSGEWATEPPAELTHSYQFTFSFAVLAEVTLTVMDEAGQTDSDTITLVNIDGSPD